MCSSKRYLNGLFQPRVLLTIIFIAALVLRLSNLEYPYFWLDEAINSLRVSGQSVADFYRDLPEGSILSFEDIERYQYPAPDKNVLDVLRVLISEEPQSTPINYIFLWYWLKLFGYSVASARSLIAVLSSLCVPLIYWLCQELFTSNRKAVGLTAAALVAVSPIHVVYSHEIRPFSLWSVMILLSTISFLRAVHTNKGWFFYSITSTLSFYTYAFTLFPIMAHFAYILSYERLKINKKFLAFKKSLLLSLICCSPWIFYIVFDSGGMNDFRKTPISTFNLVKLWTTNFTRIFWDFNISPWGEYEYIFPVALILIFLFSISVIYLKSKEKISVVALILGLILLNVIPLAVPDLIFGGVRSSIARYFFPAYLGIELAIAYFLGCKASSAVSSIKKASWLVTVVVILSVGLLSCQSYLYSNYWWNKGNNLVFINSADIVNNHPNSRVIGEYSKRGLIRLLTLEKLLRDDIQLQLGISRSSTVDELLVAERAIFLFDPSEASLAVLESRNNLLVKPLRVGRSNMLYMISNDIK